MTAAGFGRKGQSDDSELARRREAFIAAERARQADPSSGEATADPSPRFGFGGASADTTIARPLKTPGMAYLLWFFFGSISAHRHYLGYHNSAFAQAGLALGGWLLVFSGNFYFLFAPFLAGIWILADAFMIPSLCREANARARGQNGSRAFAY